MAGPQGGVEQKRYVDADEVDARESAPGVHGRLDPAGADPDRSGRAGAEPFSEAEPAGWGDEGGAGVHRGGPIISDTDDDAEDEVDRRRRAAGIR
ncbi:hypothetical protein [Chondromyces crocatus]|uniref:Uncharacterized protein n=1 Tax=Chondromyces crocatus TaxID=52 RepID=A0A0K1ED56_CHOCO|nr:hypothetical protein [Chondromyces crocatus]AKT38779.1 uncharacterized protein CMC5_029250 [Chondromyces crocatus]